MATKALRVMTPADVRVGQGVARGLTNEEIAGELGWRPAAVKSHLSRLYALLGVRSRHGLLRWWIEHVERRGECAGCLLRQAHGWGLVWPAPPSGATVAPPYEA